MTLSNGQALAGAHIPALGPLRETVKLPPKRLNAARDQASQHHWNIRDCQERRQGRLGSASHPEARPAVACGPAHGHRPNHPICSCHHAPRGGSTNSVVRVMLIMYVKCVSGLGHIAIMT